MGSELSKFYRVPKININLPSGGNYYAEGEVNLSIDGTLPISAMTARDELMLKSPDALLNGDCLVHIIQSCVPAIKNPKKLLAPDVESILLGIFYASYGPTISFKSICTNKECNHENAYEIEIRKLLDTVKTIEFPAVVEINLGEINSVETILRVFVKPYTFETNTRHQLTLFEHTKMLQVLADNTMDDQKKLATFNSCFEKMVQLKFENILECIEKFEIREKINNEWVVKTEDSIENIKDFVFNAEKSLIDPIIEKVDSLNSKGIDSEYDVTCDKCSNNFKTQLDFDPVSFFVKDSNR